MSQFKDEVVSLWSFMQDVKQIAENPKIESVVISREMVLFLGQHINLLEEQLDAARSGK